MNTKMHVCGGTILDDCHAGVDYSYCAQCYAFVYADSIPDTMPTGTDVAENLAAWHDSELRSPDDMNS